MKKLNLILAALLLLQASSFAQNDLATVEKNFLNIPSSQQIAVYWYWLGGNMSEEGVVKDLKAMKEVGINRVQITMIDSDQGASQGPVRLFTEEWWKILDTMFKTASDLGIDVGFFNCPGWTQSGGPWVKPEQSMRYLAYSKDTLSGPSKFSGKLPDTGPESQPVNVIAYPLKEASTVFSAEGDIVNQSSIILKSERKAKVRSIILEPVHTSAIGSATLFVRKGNDWEEVQSFKIFRNGLGVGVGFWVYAPIVISLPETEGDEFKLELSKAGLIQDVQLSDLPVVERYPEKSLAKMWQESQPLWDAYMWRDQPDYCGVDPKQVLDITDKMSADGTLNWNVPKGKWVVMRTAMRPTNITNGPAPIEGRGLETDKMSKKHIRAHFDNYIGKILERIPAEHRKTFKYVVEDSYETGGQNWTDDMIPDFIKAFGYDPTPYLPVLSGVVVGNEDISDRFLWDLRRFIADEISYNYVGGLTEVSHEHGMTTWLENYGHWGFPGEFLQYGSLSDEVAGEFWSNSSLGNLENRVASSCAHTYGKSKTWAESFTYGGPDFTTYPAVMKKRCDYFFTEGINSTLLHLYVQQPDDRVPGINAYFGSEFNRNNTWFSQLDVFIQYLKRCNYMLQQGRYVADVAYFIGEDAPKMDGIRDPEIPKGYSFDYVNAEVLMGASVKNGKLVLKSGMEYSLLVLPKLNNMRPELLKKLQELVADGMIMLGPAPCKSPSLTNYPECDREVQSIAKAMWQEDVLPFSEEVKYGKGRIYRSGSIEQIMNDLGIVPDFASDDPVLPLKFIHLQDDGAQIYFLSNQEDSTIAFDGIFRTKNMMPELWDPQTSEIRCLPQYSNLTKTTKVPLELQPFQSIFVVFRKDAPKEHPAGVNFPAKVVLETIDTPWTISFQDGRGGPEGPMNADTLFDWSTSSDYRIKYFSGTAVYTNSFKLRKLPETPVYIDLGKVMVMAKVKVNGQYAGGVWTNPYRVNISEFLKKGSNTVEIEVVNNWRNRIIGEMNLPESERFTFQSTTYQKKTSPLQPSGLLGPVEIQTFSYQTEK